MDDVLDLSLVDVAHAIRDGQVSSLEVTEAILQRIDQHNPRLNCYLTVFHEQAVAQARALDQLLSAGVVLSPLHGVPVALKDNLAVAGGRTTAGSRILGGWVPDTDATVARRLREAGAVIVGKTHMYEFGFGDWHPDFGETRNPWDDSRCCAASSSGSACAVSARLAYGALGTDTGGSIRLPAAACGIVGLKPTYGLVSRYGMVPGSHTLDHVGPMARTVRDVAALLEVIAGPDDCDPGTQARPADGYAAALGGGLLGLTIGVPRRQSGDRIDSEVLGAYEVALGELERHGARLLEVQVPDQQIARTVEWVVASSELAEHQRDWLRERADDYTPGVRARLRLGQLLPAVDYVHALRVRESMRRDYERVLTTCDVVALPVVPIPAWPVGSVNVEFDGVREEVNAAASRYTPTFNLTGLPAIALPCGFTARGLPLAYQIAGRRMDDATVLRVAHAYQASTDWHLRAPRGSQGHA